MIRLAALPWLVLALAALPAGAVWLLRRRWQRFPFPEAHQAARRSPRPRRADTTLLAGLLAAAALLPLAVALARPQQVLARNLERSLGIDIVLVLDVSISMAALDFKPSDRLEVAKEVMGSFLDRRPQDRFALLVFAGAAVTLCPLTLDHQVVHRLLEGIELRSLPDGTAIGVGLGTAVNRLRSSSSVSKVIVLVTDGASNTGQLDPLTAAGLAAQEGITVHTVLVGDGGEVPIPVSVRDPRSGRVRTEVRRARVKINPELLADIARTTGGTAFRARDAAALEQVFDEIDSMERSELEATRMVRYRERFQPWAWATFVLLIAAVLGEAAWGLTPW